MPEEHESLERNQESGPEHSFLSSMVEHAADNRETVDRYHQEGPICPGDGIGIHVSLRN